MAAIQDPGATPEALGIRKIGVIGAGQMGSGIAHVAAITGIEVVLNDVGQEQLDGAIENIGKNLERQVDREKITATEKKEALTRIIESMGFENTRYFNFLSGIVAVHLAYKI